MYDAYTYFYYFKYNCNPHILEYVEIRQNIVIHTHASTTEHVRWMDPEERNILHSFFDLKLV